MKNDYPLLDIQQFKGGVLSLSRSKAYQETKEEADAHKALEELAASVKKIRNDYQAVIEGRSIKEGFKTLFKRPDHIKDAATMLTIVNGILNQVGPGGKSAVEGYQLALRVVAQMFAKGMDHDYPKTKAVYHLTLNKNLKKHHFYRMTGALLQNESTTNSLASTVLNRSDTDNKVIHVGKAKGFTNSVGYEISKLTIPAEPQYTFSKEKAPPLTIAKK